MGTVVEAVVPSRLGTSFRWLLASSWTNDLGDGIALAAGPLLVASQTESPLLVSMAALVQRLPWLLFGLYAGVLADRLDRRLLIVVVNLVRAAVLGVLVASIASDTVNIAVVLAVLFVLGTAETFADTTSTTLLPMLIAKQDLGVGNARMMAGRVTINQMAGPPLGAALFAVGMVWPFLVNVVFVLLGAALISRIVLSTAAAGDDEATPAREPARQAVVAGVRWLWHHPPVRTLALTILTFNVTFGAAWSVLVLYASERLGLGEVGFGTLTTIMAAGGVLGIVGYGWLERRFSLANIMRTGLLIETFTHLTLALTTTPAVAFVTFFVFGAHAFVWGTTSQSVRQRAVPTGFQGRVSSVYLMCVMGGIVVGSALGGVLADVWGLTAPFVFAFIGSAIILVLIWPHLGHIAHAEADVDDATPDSTGYAGVAT